jgi:hypothetical protein
VHRVDVVARRQALDRSARDRLLPLRRRTPDRRGRRSARRQNGFEQEAIAQRRIAFHHERLEERREILPVAFRRHAWVSSRRMQIPGLDVKLDEAALPWRSTRYRGIQWLPLHADGAANDPRDATVLIRMEPGCGYPAHRHVDVEDVLILRGGYADERGEHGPGTYLRYPKGSSHAPRALGDPHAPIGPANPACILFAVSRGGVENLEPERRGASGGDQPRS